MTEAIELPTGARWTNSAGNQSFTPRHAASPKDEEEVAALVRAASRRGLGVRVGATGHSFTPIVQTDGLLLDLSALSGVLKMDARSKRVTAFAGTQIRDFYEPLWNA